MSNRLKKSLIWSSVVMVYILLLGYGPDLSGFFKWLDDRDLLALFSAIFLGVGVGMMVYAFSREDL